MKAKAGDLVFLFDFETPEGPKDLVGVVKSIVKNAESGDYYIVKTAQYGEKQCPDWAVLPLVSTEETVDSNTDVIGLLKQHLDKAFDVPRRIIAVFNEAMAAQHQKKA